MKGLGENTLEKIINETRLNNYNVEVIMTRGVGKLEPTDRINVALDIFAKNLFRALPVVEDDKLVGIVTVDDIIDVIREEETEAFLQMAGAFGIDSIAPSMCSIYKNTTLYIVPH